jgi:hypothetical protein
MDKKDIDAIVAGVAKVIKPKISIVPSGELNLYGKILATSSVVTVATVECPEDEWWRIDVFCGSDSNAISSGNLTLAKITSRTEQPTDMHVGFQSNPAAAILYFANASFWVFPGEKLRAVFTGAAAGDVLECWATGVRHRVSKE